MPCLNRPADPITPASLICGTTIFFLKNDLQSIVEKKYPVIKKLLLNISNEKGCYFSRMTGSGSACYGLFRDKRSSKVALKRLRKKYPKFWFSIAKSI